MSKTISASFILERETKGALRYAQTTGPDSETPFTIDEGAEIGTLYVRKTAFNGDGMPKRLSVVVTVA